MPQKELSLISDISKDSGVSEEVVSKVIASFCKKIHRRIYEYDEGNGDYVTEGLSFEMSDESWIHLYQFLLLDRLRHGQDYPSDAIDASATQLMYMGGPERWRRYFDEMKDWDMSKRFGLPDPLYR